VSTLPPSARESLASLVSRLLSSNSALDLRKWVAGCDYTADRAGLLIAHDLESAVQVIRAEDPTVSVTAKERARELVQFAVSEEYFALREKLQVSI
jgi:hypothetical protein